MKKYNKILIIGGSGVGKTTLSNKLSKIYDLPITHIDALHHTANWEVRDEKERDNIIKETVKKEKWIFDGTYTKTLEERAKETDLIIWLDYSTFAQIRGILKRFIQNRGKERPEIPGCKERMNKDFFMKTLQYRKEKRPKVVKILENGDKEKILRFTKQYKLNKWVRKIEEECEC